MSLASRDIEYFLEIARFGQLARAASTLGLTPAAMSKSVRRIECEVGMRLFERTGEGMRLTSFGMTFHDHALRIKAQYDEALRHASDLRTGRAGLLRIGTTIGLLGALVAPALALLQPRRPAMRAQISVAASDEVLERLRQAQVDLAVVPTYDVISPGLTHTDLGVDFFAPVVRQGHPFLDGQSPTLSVLSRHDWILPGSQSPARAKFEAVFRRAGLNPPSPAIEVDIGSALTLSIVGATDLISFVPDLAMGTEAARLISVLPTSELVLQRTLSLFRRPESYQSPLMEEIMQTLKQLAGANHLVRPTSATA